MSCQKFNIKYFSVRYYYPVKVKLVCVNMKNLYAGADQEFLLRGGGAEVKGELFGKNSCFLHDINVN